VKKLRVFGPLACLVLAVVFPVLLSPNLAVTGVAVFSLIFAIAVTGWNIFSGYTGYISLGHSAYYGLGAYTLALACQNWHIPGGYAPFLLLPLAGLVAGAFAFPLGWVALRTRRHTFVVITIALLFILQLMAFNLTFISGGSGGVFEPLTPWDANTFDLPFYYVALTVLLLAIGVSWWVRHSKYGLGLLAIRDDEDRALGLGVPTEGFKLTAYVISAVFVGMAGALYGYYVGIIYPAGVFDPGVDVTIALMGFLGGLGVLAGPLVGALLVTPLQQYLDLQFGGNGLNLVLLGALFLAIILLLPRGVVPSLQEQWRRRQAARKTQMGDNVPARPEQPVKLAERGGEG
jgi:branched-chain amino acid transport system permease protein